MLENKSQGFDSSTKEFLSYIKFIEIIIGVILKKLKIKPSIGVDFVLFRIYPIWLNTIKLIDSEQLENHALLGLFSTLSE